jgi:predicted transposase/invertase (TIGR01784 family)
MLQNKDGLVLDDHKIIINIYIPNLRRKCYNEGIEKLEEVEKYLLVLTEKGINEAKEIGGNIEIMDEYIDEAVEVSYESGFGEAYDKEEAIYDDGIKKGMEQGMKNEKIEIAKSLLEHNISIDIIMESTGLTKEEIEKLRDKKRMK